MKKYFTLMKCGMSEGIMYRSNFLTSMLANFIQVAVLFFVWKSIFAYQPVVSGYTWEMMRKYVFVSFLCNSALSFGFEMQAADKIISGDMVLDLLKPVSYRSIVFCRAAGTALIEFFFTLVLVGAVYLAVNGAAGITPIRLLLFLISLVLGQGIKLQIQYFFSLICFYTDNAYGVLKGREILTNFFSGALIPLAMFPDFIRTVIDRLPFSGIVYVPCSIFIGTFPMRECFEALFFQILWNVLLFLAGSIFWKKASSVISVYGG
ncbi:MAG TPA: ABC-2 family transporter protein [Candidatus Blautia ornithocaccae]|uniref:ABC transporter permease n=1 Tax=Blautia sp. An81 TaxID=1965659 RepID=UPI000B3AFF9A|nr:ABC-2 family transporter protein [Blautia sp. An81]OUN28230.1 hypothetical protein B5G33_12710 [Blautia sp. An81]HJD37569.1 ABC-2 family transporter protein [Candidatus Blautia ornithocaccae]